MTAGNYGRSLALVLKFEGGWSNHKSDPGGATMRGVTQRRYNQYRTSVGLALQSVRHITEQELQAIYRSGYWNVVNGDGLAAGVDLAVFDAAVNSGPGRAKSWLMASLGGPHNETVKRVCGRRLSFVQGLGTWKVFGRGWSRRIAEIEAVGVSWALAAMGASQGTVRRGLTIEAEAAQAVSGGQKKAAGTVGAGAGGTAASAPLSGDEGGLWFMVAIAALVALAAFAYWRSRVNADRAEAYAKVAQEIRG